MGDVLEPRQKALLLRHDKSRLRTPYNSAPRDNSQHASNTSAYAPTDAAADATANATTDAPADAPADASAHTSIHWSDHDHSATYYFSLCPS